MQLKIGELARRTGLTVRALHHYDDIGLLKPSARTDSGYRLYAREDIARLYRIQALQRLDVSLADIGAILDNDEGGLCEIVARQLSSLERQIRQATELRTHLAALQTRLRASAEPTVDEWLATLESMVAAPRYFSDEELARLKSREGAPADALRQEKAELTASLQALIRAGASPEDAEAVALARRWIDILLEEANGDEGMLMKLYTMHWNEPALHSLTGIGQAGMTFISHAMAFSRLGLYAAYCNAEEMAVLRTHYVRQTDAWPPLIGEIRNHLLRGVAPDSADMRPLAGRWLALSLAKAGGDAKLHSKLQTAFRNEAALRLGSGIDAPLAAYVGEAIRSLELQEARREHQEGTMHPTKPANAHFFTGNFAPVHEEHDVPSLDVTGHIPEELSGALYRVGPNPRHAPRDNDYHWFSGDGMVHAFFIENGQVAYRNRWARTPKWELEHRAGRALFGSFGNPATSDPITLGNNSGTANTNMVWHGGRLFALEESHQPFELDSLTLESKGHQSFGGQLKARCTAHPKVDAETGELHFFAYSPEGPGTSGMLYGVMDPKCEVTRLEAFEAPYASMAHDFMLTRKHVLFPVMPLTTSVERAMRGKPLLAWETGKRTHVGVMRRGGSTATMRWFEADACHVFHVMNAWDDGETVVAYVMQAEVAPGLPDAQGRPGDPDATAARLCRWTFDLAGSASGFQREYLDDLVAEFPRIDDRYAGLRNRYGFYTCHATPRPRDDSESVLYDSLARFDFETGQRDIHTLPAGDVVSEPVFVPRSAAAGEGDGWLLAVVWREKEKLSDLLVLDAMNLGAGPLALAHLPHRVPFGFHGNWRSSAPSFSVTNPMNADTASGSCRRLG